VVKYGKFENYSFKEKNMKIKTLLLVLFVIGILFPMASYAQEPQYQYIDLLSQEPYRVSAEPQYTELHDLLKAAFLKMECPDLQKFKQEQIDREFRSGFEQIISPIPWAKWMAEDLYRNSDRQIRLILLLKRNRQVAILIAKAPGKTITVELRKPIPFYKCVAD
jgi:hypothetical protein